MNPMEPEYARAKRLYRTLDANGKSEIDAWIQRAKVGFYDTGRPYHTAVPCPVIRGISQRTMFALLYVAMDYDQRTSPPHTPPLSPR